MLLLVAIALVLIGVATLIVGIFSDTLIWVFVSIGSTVLAGVVLYVLYRLGRKQAVAEPTSPVWEPVAERATTPAPQYVPPLASASISQETELVPAVGGFAPDDDGADDGLEDGFPIADYDDLRVAEILPLLPELDMDELVMVRGREVADKARATIVARIDELAGGVPVATAAPTSARPPIPAHAPAVLPIANYDGLKVAEILPLIRRLSADDLDRIAEHEESNANRQTILNLIDSRLDAIEAAAPAAKAVAPAKSAAKKTAPPKKAAATKSASSKSASSKSAPSKSVPTKSVPTRSVPTKVVANKAAVTKAGAKKAPAKVAATRPAAKAPGRPVAAKAPARTTAKAPTKTLAKKSVGRPAATKAPAKSVGRPAKAAGRPAAKVAGGARKAR